jgi:hypothetical protein
MKSKIEELMILSVARQVTALRWRGRTEHLSHHRRSCGTAAATVTVS